MAISLDSTAHSTVVVCSLCGCHDLASDPRDGWLKGAAHERVAHPELQQAREAGRMNQNRDTPS